MNIVNELEKVHHCPVELFIEMNTSFDWTVLHGKKVPVYRHVTLVFIHV